MDTQFILTAMLFLKPLSYETSRLWMLLPLSLAVAVVYKTSRMDNLRALPVAILLLWGSIVGGMLLVAVVLYVIMMLFL